MTARVMVVDDHQLLADSLMAALAMQGLAVTMPRSFEMDVVLAEATTWEPDVVLLDLWIPQICSTLPLVAPLRTLDASVVMVTGETDRLARAECLEAGAAGIISKAEPFEHLVASVLAVTSGRPLMSVQERDQYLVELREHRARAAELGAPFEQLTARERDVLAGLVRGLSAEQLAAETYVSMATIRSHIRSILTKLGVHSQLAAVAMARNAAWEP